MYIQVNKCIIMIIDNKQMKSDDKVSLSQQLDNVDSQTYQQDIIQIIRGLNQNHHHHHHHHHQKCQSTHHKISTNLKLDNANKKCNKKNAKIKKMLAKNLSEIQHLDENSQYSQSNHKITQYFGQKFITHKQKKTFQILKTQQSQEEIIIKSLRQKIEKKQKQIDDLQKANQQIKHKNQEYHLKIKKRMQQQRQQLVDTLKQKYYYLIYYSSLKGQNMANCVTIETEDRLARINNKLQLLKSMKDQVRRRKKNIFSDEQENTNKDLQEKDKKLYINAWISRVEKQREKINIQKEGRDRMIRQDIKDLPEQLMKLIGKTQTLNCYLPLCMMKGQRPEQQEILCMQLDTLKEQVLNIIPYPRFMNQFNKNKVYYALQQIHKTSKKLTNSIHNTLLIPNTIVCELLPDRQYFIIGLEQMSEIRSLHQIILESQSLPESLIRYLVRICLKLFSQFEIKTGQSCVILPLNILLNSKYEFKFKNIPYNMLFIRQQFKSLLVKTEDYYYYSPQALQGTYSNLSFWSLGILLYELTFGKKPFNYSINSRYSRNSFFIINQLEFPNKSAGLQKCKDFIKTCLTCSSNQIKEVTKHPYLNSK